MEHVLLQLFGLFYAIPALCFVCEMGRRLFFPYHVIRLAKSHGPQDQPSDHLLWIGVKKIWSSFVLFVARVEYGMGFFRFWTLGLLIWVWFFWTGAILFIKTDLVLLHRFLFLGMMAGLVAWQRGHKTCVQLRAAQFLKEVPGIHPVVFFDRYKLALAFGLGCLFVEGEQRTVSPAHADFRKGGRSVFNTWVLIKGLFDTATCAHLILACLRTQGASYVMDLADCVGRLWGCRMLQLACCQFRISGVEKLNGKQGRFLFVFNHKSAMDFVLAFFALSEIRVNSRFLRPRFILAEDHFKHNWLIYGFLGLGRACEAVQMVFLSRRDHAKSVADLKEAAQKIAEKDIDIVIYPQGTRAEGNFDRAGKRRDAGYYTTIRKSDLVGPMAHLKKGTSHLVLNTLSELLAKPELGDLNLVFIGINGTATVLPKNSLKVQTESCVEFAVGDVVSLSPKLLGELFDPDMSDQESESVVKQFAQDMSFLINEKLLAVLGFKQILLQRYLTELKGQFKYDQEKIGVMMTSIRKLSEQGDVVFRILDRVYSLPLLQWNGYLSQLSQLLMEQVSLDRLDVLLADVSEELLKRG